MAKRKQSDSVRKMRLVILGIAVALVAAVVAVTWFTLSREAENGEIQWRVSSTTEQSHALPGEPTETTTNAVSGTTTPDIATTTNADGLPYDRGGSDAYAEWDGKYPTAEVIIKKGNDGKWGAYVTDKKVQDCNGLYCNEYGWWFVRNGDVDYNYTGIVGNDKGKWYVSNGKANFQFSGTFNPLDSSRHYTVVEGNVVRES